MTTEPKPDSTRDVAIRSACLDMAIRSNCGQCYDTEGKMIFDAGEIVKAASMFEAFIKGIKPFVEGVSNNPNNPEIKFKKESW